MNKSISIILHGTVVALELYVKSTPSKSDDKLLKRVKRLVVLLLKAIDEINKL